MIKTKTLNMALLSLGLLLFAFLVYRIDPAAIAVHFRALGWRLILLLLPYAFGYFFFTLGWKATLADGASVPFPKLFLIRQAGEAINSLTFSASLGGEPVKTYLLRSCRVPLEKGLTSIVVTKTAMTLAQMTFTVIGVILTVRQIGLKSPFLAFSAALVMAWIPAMAFFIIIQRQGLFAGLLQPAKRLSFLKTWLQRWGERINDLDRQIAAFYTKDARSLVLSYGLHLGGWMVQSLEVYWLLSFLKLPVDLPTALAVQGLSVLTKAAAFVIPGALGVQEGGNLLIFLGFSLPVEAGMTFSLVRRGRELLWIGLGLAMLARYSLQGQERDAGIRSVVGVSQEKGRDALDGMK
ncbi:MAG: flippase-like domain-containing protein [candidate division NC10 bacterium]|nr:flippase-like domain-containing protein [candidate division NC10 bacterium]